MHLLSLIPIIFPASPFLAFGRSMASVKDYFSLSAEKRQRDDERCGAQVDGDGGVPTPKYLIRHPGRRASRAGVWKHVKLLVDQTRH